MKHKVGLILALSLCVSVFITGCGDEIKIDSRTDNSVAPNNGIEYSPNDDSGVAVEEVTEELLKDDDAHVHTESTSGAFRFGTTADGEATIEMVDDVADNEEPDVPEDNIEEESEDDGEEESSDTQE